MNEASDIADADLFEKGCTDDPRVLGNREFMQVVPRSQRTYRSTHSLDQVIDTVSSKLGLERCRGSLAIAAAPSGTRSRTDHLVCNGARHCHAR